MTAPTMPTSAATLLDRVIDAHGGMSRWLRLHTVEATIVTGGALWAMKGLVQDAQPRHMKVWLHEQRASVMPFGAPDQRTDYTPGRIAIEKTTGETVAERFHPKDSFAGHTLTTPWDNLHRAYFNGLSLWTYLSLPFLLAAEGVALELMPAWHDGAETWQRLRAHIPRTITTHASQQDFFFGRDFLLRRHDYGLDVLGGFAATQLVSAYTTADGICLATHRLAYRLGGNDRPVMDPVMVSIHLSDVRYS